MTVSLATEAAGRVSAETSPAQRASAQSAPQRRDTRFDSSPSTGCSLLTTPEHEDPEP